MRVSNINQYAGGADDVIAEEFVQGSVWTTQVTIQDENNMPIDLTSATFRLQATYAKTASITYESGRAGSTATLGQITKDAAFSAAVDFDGTGSSTDIITVTDAANGVLEIEWPADMYTADVPLDAATDIPTIIATLIVFNSSGQTEATIRFLRFVRFGLE